MKYPTKVVPSGFRCLCAFLALVVIFPCASAEVVEGAVGARETVTDGTDGGVYLGLHGGTLGAGPVLGYEFSKRLGVRGQLDWFDYETDSVGDDEYSGNLEFRSGSLLFDWNPLSGAFRFTAGAVANQSEIWAATKDASVDLGGRSYAGTANLQVGFDSVAPYLGFGWSAGRKDGGMRLLLDVGVVFKERRRYPPPAAWARAAWAHAASRYRARVLLLWAGHYATWPARKADNWKRIWPRNIAC